MLGWEKELGYARGVGGEGKEKVGRAEELGSTVKKEKKKGSGRLGWTARGKKIGKRKGESGPGAIRKRDRKRIVSKCI
jgi:hypothetical protein